MALNKLYKITAASEAAVQAERLQSKEPNSHNMSRCLRD